MKHPDLTHTITVDQTPEEAFAAINNVRGWWSGEIDGNTAQLGDEFTYRYQDIHKRSSTATLALSRRRLSGTALKWSST
jgi:hypothetical protein